MSLTMLPDITESLFGARILIVDDSNMQRQYLHKTLNQRGFYALTLVDSGEAALVACREFEPDLVILDIVMPGMGGYACCRAIREMPNGQDLPILVQTALTDPRAHNQAFTQGATDVVSKPLMADELYARIVVHLERRVYLRKLQRYKERMDIELESARELQQAILPGGRDLKLIRNECGLDIVAHFEPSSEIGGDFWGAKQLDARRLAFWIVDFSGHGVAAALNAFRLQAYLMEHAHDPENPGACLSQLNEKLLQLTLKGQFATMFYGVIDTRSGQLRYASAGSPHPLLLREGEPALINASGLPLGIAAHTYPTNTRAFQPGDTLMIYSDALIETENHHGDCLDESDLMAWMREGFDDSAALLERVLERFRRHTTGKRDDLTIAVFKR